MGGIYKGNTNVEEETGQYEGQLKGQRSKNKKMGKSWMESCRSALHSPKENSIHRHFLVIMT